jgi:ribosomal protein L11
MYYIYHIPGIKIGCSKNPQKRTRQQRAIKYEILETHADIHIASEREIQLQKQYGYKVDITTYYNSTKAFKIETVRKAGTASATKKWKENRDRELEKCSKAGKVNGEKTSKIIQQCDLDWNILKTFSSTKEAAKSINGHASVIRMTILSKGTYRGFRWKYPTT